MMLPVLHTTRAKVIKGKLACDSIEQNYSHAIELARSIIWGQWPIIINWDKAMCQRANGNTARFRQVFSGAAFVLILRSNPQTHPKTLLN